MELVVVPSAVPAQAELEVVELLAVLEQLDEPVDEVLGKPS